VEPLLDQIGGAIGPSFTARAYNVDQTAGLFADIAMALNAVATQSLRSRWNSFFPD
jgi:putative effector of murein hydrolase